MPFLRSLNLAVAAGLIAAIVPVAATAAAPTAPSGPPPDRPVLDGRSNAAERALGAVRAAFAEHEERAGRVGPHGGELTMQLVQLRLGLDELSAQERDLAEGFLARPTEGTEWYGANYGPRARPTNDCTKAPTPGSDVCVHWARRTEDAPPGGDADGDGLPNQVEKTRDAFNRVWGRVVDAGGYSKPLPDEKGPNSKLDVYLVDIGNDGLYGYCTPEPVGQGRSEAAYCVLDDDYAKTQFPSGTPSGNLKVTAAHEFFHAVQFGYDVREDAWLMETTATWLEDEVYDGVNDNRGFLSASVLRFPERPLDTVAGSFYYGNWIWWRYLTERFPRDAGGLPVLVRHVWERARHGTSSGTYSMDALARTLTDEYGPSLPYVFAEFANANRMPVNPKTAIYEEGRAYRKAPLSRLHKLDSADRPAIAQKSPELPHMSATTVAFQPAEGYAGPWRIRLDVDLPNSSQRPFAQVTVFNVDGSVERFYVTLSGEGTGSARADFSSTTVKRVELTLSNGDHSYDCNRQTNWSCAGKPDPKRAFRYSASTRRAS